MSDPILIAHKYGIRLPIRLSDLELELYCFRNKLDESRGGLGTTQHCKNAINILWPKLVWNPWLEEQIDSLCKYDYVGWSGCGASGKTFGATLFAMVWWMANPKVSAVVLTSTTANMIRKRMWANVQTLSDKVRGFPGNRVDSKMALQSSKGDDLNAISAIAVADGNTSKAVANIQGIHTERVMVVIDEATDTPEAAFEACTNLSKGCREFKMLVIGNPASKFDPHGKFCTPVDGWRSVGIGDVRWETVRGVCVRFDGLQSPNLDHPKTKYPFLITREQVDAAIRHEGEESPTFWKFTRGFWAPDGMVKTILSESMIEMHMPDQKFVFAEAPVVCAALDPGFGGDRCILRFAKVGLSNQNRLSVQYTDTVQVQVNANDPEPIHYQISNRVRQECDRRGVPPQNLAMDSTGEGGGLADIFSKEWGEVFRVEFGGAPSELPVSDQDSRPASEVYDRKVTELWFSIRKWVMDERIGGLDQDTLKEFCGRMFDDSKRKISIEPKKEMKRRTGKSPDLADAAAILLDFVRNTRSLEVRATKTDKKWNELAQLHDAIYYDHELQAV